MSNNGVPLKYGLEIIQGDWMWHQSIHNATSHQSAVVTVARSYIIRSYLTLNNIMTLKSSLRVTHGHWKKWHYSIDRLRVPWFHLCHFRDKARKIENCDFLIPNTFIILTPMLECCRNVWYWKAKMIGLPEGEKVWEYVSSFWYNTNGIRRALHRVVLQKSAVRSTASQHAPEFTLHFESNKSHSSLKHNFGKCWPIKKIISQLNSAKKLQ